MQSAARRDLASNGPLRTVSVGTCRTRPTVPNAPFRGSARAYTYRAAPTLSGGRPCSSLPAVGRERAGSAGVWTTCASEWAIRSVALVDNWGTP
jgi:hypothetical protein